MNICHKEKVSVVCFTAVQSCTICVSLSVVESIGPHTWAWTRVHYFYTVASILLQKNTVQLVFTFFLISPSRLFKLIYYRCLHKKRMFCQMRQCNGKACSILVRWCKIIRKQSFGFLWKQGLLSFLWFICHVFLLDLLFRFHQRLPFHGCVIFWIS